MIMRIIKFAFVFILTFLGHVSLSGETEYKITVSIKGSEDTVLYLAHYYGDKTYLDDTAFVKKGKFVFNGDSLLHGGIYIIAGQKNNRYFELIIDKEQKFFVATDISNVIDNISFKNSEDNTLFYEYIRFNTEMHQKIGKLKRKLSQYADNPDSVLLISNEIDTINKQLGDYKIDFINEHPDSFISVLFNAMWEPDPQNVPVLENGREDSIYVYQYYKQHYWDKFDLTDDRLLHTPLYNNKLKKYFEQVLYQEPDTIINEADKLIAKTEPSKEMFKYTVWWLTYKFETSKVMGFDRIFVHMVDKYYATGKAFWAAPTVVKSITERANSLRPILLGETAPEMILIDTANGFTSLHHTEADYLIVLFYEYGCGHCKKEIKAMKKWVDSAGYDIKVFAVCTDTSLVKWKKFIKDYKITNWINVNGTRSVTPDYHDLYDVNMTPTIFLLDEKKKIIAKKLKTEQLRPFLENYIFQRQPAGNNSSH
jgi:peroxiredoxin